MDEILPGLYIGSYHDSRDDKQLRASNITHVLSIYEKIRPLRTDLHYLCVLVPDRIHEQISQHFHVCNSFIHAARMRGGNVLIHCWAGMSRSTTIAAAYIMTITNLTCSEALKFIRYRRKISCPNPGFETQLIEFQAYKLNEERKRLRDCYPWCELNEKDQLICNEGILKSFLMEANLDDKQQPSTSNAANLKRNANKESSNSNKNEINQNNNATTRNNSNNNNMERMVTQIDSDNSIIVNERRMLTLSFAVSQWKKLINSANESAVDLPRGELINNNIIYYAPENVALNDNFKNIFEKEIKQNAGDDDDDDNSAEEIA